MTWQTGTATDYLDLLDQLEQVATGESVDSATVSAGGSGYTAGDTLTGTGGTFTHAPTFEVLTVDGGGAVTSLRLVNGGAYTVTPSSPVSTTGGTGTGATVAVTFDSTGWTTVLDETPSGERQIILQGTGSGSDEIFVGFKTYQAVNGLNTAYNWSVVGMTGFSGALPFAGQPGISPGATPSSTGGAYVPLHNNPSFPIAFWFSITPRRIIVVAKVENATITHYVSCHVGWLNPYGTATEYPYPMYVAGSTARHDTLFNSAIQYQVGGLGDPAGISGKTGPGYYRDTLGVWREIKNSILADGGSPSRSDSNDYVIYPTGEPDYSSTDLDVGDRVVVAGLGLSMEDLVPTTGVPGTPTLQLQQTPETGDDLFVMIPLSVHASSDPNFALWGEVDDLFWFSAVGGVSSEDTILKSSTGERFHIFQNGNVAQVWSFFALKEN